MDRRSFLALLPAFALLAPDRQSLAREQPSGVLTIAVSIDNQHLSVFDGLHEIATSPVSTGRAGHATPTGIFSILDKRRHHRSNIYSQAPMPFMQRLTWSGIALHASNHVPSYPASHGCVRMPEAFARELYTMTDIGLHVVIAPGAVRPERIVHPALFQPVSMKELIAGGLTLRLRPREIGEHPIRIASAAPPETIVTDASEPAPEAPIRMLVTRRTHRELTRDVQHLLNVLGFDAGSVDGFIGPMTVNALRAFQREAGLPATGLIRREEIVRLYRATGKGEPPTGHLYVRRNFAPLFDTPVTIVRPELPLGAHLFTVDAVEGDHASWMALSLPDRPRPSVANGADIIAIEEDGASPTPRSVLDRITVEEPVRDRIARLLTAGASLAISDNGLGPETGKGTDFVVLTHA